MTQDLVKDRGSQSAEQGLEPDGEDELEDSLPAGPSASLQTLSFEQYRNEYVYGFDETETTETTETTPGPSSKRRPQYDGDEGRNKRFKETDASGVPPSYLKVLRPLAPAPPKSERSTVATPSIPTGPAKLTENTSPAGLGVAPSVPAGTAVLGEQEFPAGLGTSLAAFDAENTAGIGLEDWPFKPLRYVSHRPISLPIGLGLNSSSQRSALLNLPEKLQLLILKMLNSVDRVVLMLTCKDLAWLAAKIHIGPLPVGLLQIRLYGIPLSHVFRMPGAAIGFAQGQYGFKPCDTCVQLQPCHPDAYRTTCPGGVIPNNWISAVSRFCLSNQRKCPTCQVLDVQAQMTEHGHGVNTTPIYLTEAWVSVPLFYNAVEGLWLWPDDERVTG